MIKDNLLHIDYYNYLSPGIYFGLKYLRDTDFSSMANGKYEIKEGKAYAIVQDYDTKPESEGKFEAHKKFVDIQFIIEGEEQVLVGKLDGFEETTPYDEEKDILFLTPKTDAKIDSVKIKSGEYVILTQKDVHMPSISVETTSHVKKVVLKILT